LPEFLFLRELNLNPFCDDNPIIRLFSIPQAHLASAEFRRKALLDYQDVGSKLKWSSDFGLFFCWNRLFFHESIKAVSSILA